MASAIALYPASLGWRLSQESYSGRNIFGLPGSRVALSKLITASYALPAIHSFSAWRFVSRHAPGKLCQVRPLHGAAALVLLAGHGLAQQNTTFNSYQVEEGWLQLPEGRRLGLATLLGLHLQPLPGA
jgi:hypothetical protein